MNLRDLAQRPAQWLGAPKPNVGTPLDGGADDGDVVISSRARLARNLAGMPFLNKCGEAQLRQIARQLQQALSALPLPGQAHYVDLEPCPLLDRQLLVERHLISRQHAEADIPRGVAVSGDETVAVMVNEEDHLRLQCLRAGLNLEHCVAQLRRLDDLLEQQMAFAFSSRLGYLTACPTNVGTGLRVSAMLHLPGLKMSGQIDKALRAARDMHLAVRGLFGEGTEATGDLFQISNQTTLGRSEEQIVADFRQQVLPAVIHYERQARQALLKERRLALEDKVCRAVGVLRSARTISSEETLYLLSHLRLGLALGLVREVPLEMVNYLFLAIQPAHLQALVGRELTPADRGRERALLIRQKLG